MKQAYFPAIESQVRFKKKKLKPWSSPFPRSYPQKNKQKYVYISSGQRARRTTGWQPSNLCFFSNHTPWAHRWIDLASWRFQAHTKNHAIIRGLQEATKNHLKDL